MTATERLADFALGVSPDDMPDEVVEAARLHFLDALGVGLAASAGSEQCDWIEAIEQDGPASIFGGARSGTAEAAMLNGALIHSLEFDDTHIGSVIHGSAVAAPVALAAAEASGADGKEMLAAYIVAWEVMIRLGLAAPGAFQTRGVQVTAVAGALGAAAAAGRLFGLNRERLVAAMGIAGSQASGLLAFLEDGTSVKALNPGWAAHSGIMAASLATGGMTGPASILESRFGTFSVFGADPKGLDAALNDLGQVWRLPEAAYKLYPCCHYIHPFLEALETLIADGLRAGDVDRLTAHVPIEQAPLIAEPWTRRQAPLSGYDGKWGLAYCLALLFVDDGLNVGSFETPPRKDISDLARRMDRVLWKGSGFPERFPAKIDVLTSDGRTLSASVETVQGAPGRPIDSETIVAKFRANAGRRLSDVAIDAVIDSVIGSGDAPDLARLSAALRA